MVNEKQLKDAFQKMQNGDREQFALIYEQLKKPVFTIAYRITLSKASAEDITHDLFLELLSSPPPPKVENPRAWIFKMARNLAIDATRKKTPIDIEEFGEIPTDTMQNEDVRIDVESALEKLPLDEREILSLHLDCGLKFSEISKLTGLSMSTAYRKYKKALETVRDMLNGVKR